MYILAGNCTIGTRCHFAHGQSELRNPNDVSITPSHYSPFQPSTKGWCRIPSYCRCALLVLWDLITWRLCYAATSLKTFVGMETVATSRIHKPKWNPWLSIISSVGWFKAPPRQDDRLAIPYIAATTASLNNRWTDNLHNHRRLSWGISTAINLEPNRIGNQPAYLFHLTHLPHQPT